MNRTMNHFVKGKNWAKYCYMFTCFYP